MANNDKGGCLLPLIIYIAFITLIACCWGVIYYWIHGGTPSYSVSVSTSSIALQAVPGHNVDLGLTGGSLQGNWASDGGLTLTLNGTAFQLVESKSPDWGDSIEYCSGAGCQNPPDNFTIPASFTLPSSYTPGATESGTLTGDLITPQGKAAGGTSRMRRRR